MDDRAFYKQLAAKLSASLNRRFFQLKFPQTFLRPIGSEGDREFLAEKFPDVALVGESVSDSEAADRIRKQRLKRLNRLLSAGLLETPFDFAKTVAGILDHERFKSIHTCFSRISDVHMLLKYCFSLTRNNAQAWTVYGSHCTSILTAFKKLFDAKEARANLDEIARKSEKQLRENFPNEISGRNVLDEQSSKTFQTLLFKLLHGFYPDFAVNYKLKDVDMNRDPVISSGYLSVVKSIDAENLAVRISKTLPQTHKDLFDCLLRYRESTGASTLFVRPATAH